MKVFLFDEQFEDELLPAGIGVPVDVPPVVAGGKAPVLGELDTGTPLGTAAFGPLPPVDQSPGKET